MQMVMVVLIAVGSRFFVVKCASAAGAVAGAAGAGGGGGRTTLTHIRHTTHRTTIHRRLGCWKERHDVTRRPILFHSRVVAIVIITRCQ
jgi:hypothetical protein